MTTSVADGDDLVLEGGISYTTGYYRTTVYFALLNKAENEQEIQFEIDFKALGIDSQACAVSEIARSIPLDFEAPNKVKLKLEPFKTSIIAVKKTS